MMNKRKMNVDDDFQVEEINISPLIDVVFILLIFFIVTMAFSDKFAMNVDVPQASNSSMPNNDFISVSISSNGEIYFQDQLCSLSVLANRIKASQKKDVLIYADKSVYADRLIAVIDTVKSVDSTSIYLATEKK